MMSPSTADIFSTLNQGIMVTYDRNANAPGDAIAKKFSSVLHSAMMRSPEEKFSLFLPSILFTRIHFGPHQEQKEKIFSRVLSVGKDRGKRCQSIVTASLSGVE